ncbi:sigma factor-like helix-turn-helix DNA-binding protein [Micromonospora sp. DPT]|uniref:sigma factor-like helix-turn-helix DNA-binding protein n=1 Tax=Micromonospora sp. DPT TaxID=3142975 RepID=UPI00320B3FBA
MQLRRQGSTYAEIAKTYGVSEQAVYNRLRQARATRPQPRHRDLLPWTVKREHTFALDAQVLRLLSREAADGPDAAEPRKRGMVNNWLRRLREEDSVVCYDRERGFFHAPRTAADGDSLIRVEEVEMTAPIDDRLGAKIREVVAIHDSEIAAERAGAVPPPPRNWLEVQTQDGGRVHLTASPDDRGQFLLSVEGREATEVTLRRADLLRLIEHAAGLLALNEGPEPCAIFRPAD